MVNHGIKFKVMNLENFLTLMQYETTKCMTYCEATALVPNIYDDLTFAHNDPARSMNIDPRYQYEPQFHDVVRDRIKRPDRTVQDSEGRASKIVYPARLPVPMQKKIVLTAAAFLGSPVLEANDDTQEETDILTAIQDTYDLNKLDYKFRAISKITMSERCCAELWYTVDAGDTSTEQYALNSKLRLRMKILARSKGDSLYPVFDEYENLIAFGRGYHVMDENAVRVQHFDVYTADNIYMSKKVDTAWYWMSPAGVYAQDFTSMVNPFKKIPVIYYWQPCSEWHDVQLLIDRYESIISNNADTNDYFGNPILLGIGKVLSLADKGAAGKTLELENGGDARYLTWDQGPKAVEMEMTELKNAIYSFTHTPDISFEKLMGLGYFSQVALRTLFSDAYFKAADKEEVFGEGVQRRINFLKSALAQLDKRLVPGMSLSIKPKFNFYVPENITEEIDRLSTAVGNGLMSKETAIDLNPLVTDSESELQRMKDEAAAAQALVSPPNTMSTTSFNVGDSVTVIPGKEHMPEHAGKTLTIAEVNGNTYAVKLPDGSIHKWYTGEELMMAGGQQPVGGHMPSAAPVNPKVIKAPSGSASNN